MSFSSTDPTLSPIQFPFFVRTAQNDLYQMSAIAEIIDHYEWREVIAIYEDDDHGRNGIAALGDKLAERRCRISYKARLSPEPTRDEITDVLVKVALRESRILVVHVPGSWGLKVFSVAQYLGMLGTGYVWIATNWLSTVLVTLRMYTPDSQRKRRFVSRVSNLTRGKPIDSTTYSCTPMTQSGRKTISFLNNSRASELSEGNLHLDALSVFQGGNLVFTGDFRFTSDRNLIHPAFEIINVIGTGYRRKPLWEKPPSRSSTSQMLHGVVWPGQNDAKTPWMGVSKQWKTFEDWSSSSLITGYCIDVFTAALNLLPYAVPYKLIPFGDGRTNPSGTELVRLITAGRIPNAFAFLRPFTGRMWAVTAIFFLLVGTVVWILEHRMNDEFSGPPRKTMTLYVTVISLLRYIIAIDVPYIELAKVYATWFCSVIFRRKYCYTASLTSILTVQQLVLPSRALKLCLKDGPHKGGVAAMVDDRAYIELFLSTRCEFSIVGQEFTKMDGDLPFHGTLL
ncbi:hypothetical protein ES319_A10G232700v1 [Gossypium barbadense]|uniref:Receptor ligand binding region domain-containing protein n=1 Tax=Gossypium barbadense TaxID=3634 RepID=A0A5J5U6R0_GOSBA|nr:hypothetical protein ES319_A10G232700v1 [Gossypium barbadense]